METQKLEGVMEFSAKILNEEICKKRLESLSDICKTVFVQMEKDKVIDRMGLEFTAFFLADEPAEDVIVHNDAEIYPLARKTFEDICKLYTRHRQTVDTDLYRTNEYMRGMFNGMEVLMSTIEEREPLFLSESGQFYRPVQLRIEGGAK